MSWFQREATGLLSVSSVSDWPQHRASFTHPFEHVSARVPLLCDSCALLFLSQPSGIEKVGALMCLPLIPMMHLGTTLARLEACVLVCACVCVRLCETPSS